MIFKAEPEKGDLRAYIESVVYQVLTDESEHIHAVQYMVNVIIYVGLHNYIN